MLSFRRLSRNAVVSDMQFMKKFWGFIGFILVLSIGLNSLGVLFSFFATGNNFIILLGISGIALILASLAYNSRTKSPGLNKNDESKDSRHKSFVLTKPTSNQTIVSNEEITKVLGAPTTTAQTYENEFGPDPDEYLPKLRPPRTVKISDQLKGTNQ